MAKRRRTIGRNPLDEPTQNASIAALDDTVASPLPRSRAAAESARRNVPPLEARVAQLERENSWMRWIAGGLVVLALAV